MATPRTLSIVGFLAAVSCGTLASFAAHATNPNATLPAGQCNLTGAVQSACPSAVTSAVSYVAGRVDPGMAATALDVWGSCRYIDNGTGTSYFVPFRSKTEWLAFLQNKPANVTVNSCVRGTSFAKNPSLYASLAISPDSNPSSATYCSTPSPTVALPSTDLPYYRPGSAIQAIRSASFTCGAGAGTWTQTVTVTYQTNPSVVASADSLSAVDGSAAAVENNWLKVAGSTTYAGTPPVLNCGSADGAYLSAKPTTNLCSDGTSATVSGYGPWSWTCGYKSCVAQWAASEICTNPNPNIPWATVNGSYSQPGTGKNANVYPGAGTVNVGGSNNFTNVYGSGITSIANTGSAACTSVSGNNNTLTDTGPNSANVYVNGTNNALSFRGYGKLAGVFGSGNTFNVDYGGGMYIVTAGSNTFMIGPYASSSNFLVYGGNNTFTVNGPSNLFTVPRGGNRFTINAGSGTYNIGETGNIVTFNGNNLYSTVTFTGASGNTVAINGSGNNITVKGTGYSIVTIAGSNNYVNGVKIN